MKWLLASMSKGRNVSDFFPHVVKLVGTQHLEVRKMVYTYLVHYADYDASCREPALLSINAFQRGLTDGDSAWIRASALRVLTSIHVADVLQIQILGVKKCIGDSSPYVRKCAANALCKLYPRVSASRELEKELIEECWMKLIQRETSTMVLSSCMMSFVEICPDRLELLHGVYRKLCHLLTDMDEWGQVVTIEVMSRYCRRFFRAPGVGSAEAIDAQRRIVRKMGGVAKGEGSATTQSTSRPTFDASAATASAPVIEPQFPHPHAGPTKVKQRVVRKAFYSDEEDESSEEEVYLSPLTGRPHKTIASVMKQQHILGTTVGIGSSSKKPLESRDGVDDYDDDYASLDDDHKLLLRCSLPLLKSRNAGVVLAVCSLQYYCGVASIRIRSAMGKALVRIYHDRREIQYVVLRAIKALVWECPSAFTPYLNDFFVKVCTVECNRIFYSFCIFFASSVRIKDC